MKRSPSAMPVSDAKLGGVISFNLNCFHGPAVAELLRGIRSLMEARSTGPPQWEAAVMSLGLTHSPDKVDIMIVQAISFKSISMPVCQLELNSLESPRVRKNHHRQPGLLQEHTRDRCISESGNALAKAECISKRGSRKKKLEKLEEGEEKEKEKSPITKAKKSFPEFH
ncbi:uncharacterized protein [Paramormyrops kingsleyae]|uniref:uncharacterized protein isoform X1 n=1 Tax=Paramormyrops kingsleyae TaxID=1676925 RepID=UPI003B976035